MKKEKVYKLNRPVNFYIPFKKMDEEQGIVYGYATTPTLDYDKQKIDMDAFAKALPEYLEYGNIREMHNRRAVGKVLNETVKMSDEGCFLGAKIIPKDVRELCEAGVYSGFSVGLSDCLLKTEEGVANGVITGDEMKIIEISLVDRPANPQARISAYKLLDGDKVETILEKLALDSEGITTPVTGGGLPFPAPVIKLTTFAGAEQTQELTQELPAALNLLSEVLYNIVFDPIATVEEKTAAMQQSVQEFSASVLATITGVELAAAVELKKETEKKHQETLDALAKAEEEKKKALEVKPEPQAKDSTALILETIKAEFTSKLDEATKQIGELRDENVKLAETNKGLEGRVKKIEETPAPPKSVANTDIVKTGDTPTWAELTQALQAAAKSNDPNLVKLASDIGQKLFTEAVKR